MIYEIPTIGPEEQAALDRIEAVRRELRYYVAEPRRWVGSVRRVLSARAIQGSNSIEGYNVSVEDAVAAIEGDDPAEARDEDWHAVMGYRRAMTYVLQLAQDRHFEYTAAIIRSLHFMMTEYALAAGPGLWRPGAIWIRNNASGDVVYEGPDPDLVPGLMEELVKQLTIHAEVPATIRGAMAHLNLAMIHPFRDGNGRMARCLQTLVLAREGILVPEFCSIEEYLGANTDAYYGVLAQVGMGRWNPQNDARPWVRFCLQAHYVQARSVLRRVRESERIWGELEELIGARGLPQRSIGGLFDATLGLRIRNSGYRAVMKSWGEEISNQVATTDLRSMVNAGLLEQRGKKRGTFYVATGPLLEIRARLRHGRQPIDTSDLFTPSSKTPDLTSEPQLPFGPSATADQS
ncbi:MAG TPA: Fic family protein [Acidimicrobiales bacterium]|nr:Fic family protein [Acidimicrobiales bacterium]